MSDAYEPILATYGLGGRLPLLDPSALRSEQETLYSYLMSTKIPWAEKSGFQGSLPDGRLIGPFNVFLSTPAMSQAFNGWVDAESSHTTLTEDVRQVIVLTVGGLWRADYETYAHAAVARKAGLTESTIRSILAGSEPEELSPDAQVAFRFTTALVSDRSVSNDLYAAAADRLTTQGVTDMVQLIGLYLATSALLNAFRIPAPTARA